MKRSSNSSTRISNTLKVILPIIEIVLCTLAFYFSYYATLPLSVSNNFNLANEIVSTYDNENPPIGVITAKKNNSYYYRFNDFNYASVEALQAKYTTAHDSYTWYSFDNIVLKSYIDEDISFVNPMTNTMESISLICSQTIRPDDVTTHILYPNISLAYGQDQVSYFPKQNEIYVSTYYADLYLNSLGLEDGNYSSIVGKTISIQLSFSLTYDFVIYGVFNPTSQNNCLFLNNTIGNYFIVRSENSLPIQPSLVFTTSNYVFEVVDLLDSINKYLPNRILENEHLTYNFFQYENDSYTLNSHLSKFCTDMYNYSSNQYIGLTYIIFSLLFFVAAFLAYFLLLCKFKCHFPFKRHLILSSLLYILISFSLSILLCCIFPTTSLLGNYSARLLTPLSICITLISLIIVVVISFGLRKKIANQ